jgi:hypothetical protein
VALASEHASHVAEASRHLVGPGDNGLPPGNEKLAEILDGAAAILEREVAEMDRAFQTGRFRARDAKNYSETMTLRFARARLVELLRLSGDHAGAAMHEEG